ncbi:LysR family transcriptional regulator [Vulgatibacter incomptus]|uniref:Transcriptional regulator, LysR family n=1 Tax=Vulgatibacter incomptus TaxID=1391653 RepID=A0A0K1PG94_9BACT|nr:LysR family transcriptional regulator [Vulgatibacter incomptus]AKU92527.1 transcriptional regulator, LysR family [Vulgatibacter incomptus]
MQLETLKVFCDVVESKSFSKAARLNRVTQSAVSQQIRSLEKRYDRKLLDRAPRAIQPTRAGEKLYEAAREVLVRFEALEAGMRAQSEEAEGPVTVATIHSVGLHEIQSHLKELLRRYPRVNVRVAYRRSDEVYEEVASGEADVGLVAYPREKRELAAIPFSEDRLVVVVPPDSPLARKGEIPLSRLDGINFVAFDRDIPTRRAVDKLLRDHGASVEVRMELDNIETVKRAVEIGLGVSVLPRAAVQPEIQAGSLVALPIADGDFIRPIGILVRRNRSLSRAAEALLEVFVGGRAEEILAGAGASK